ncbi:MAG: ABC transporter ATP-binding protein [Deltaproteobacteria bacterium]|nr:ABC transporter ATP-binding protein [Deltaproteobacteria bacterium]
MAIRGKVKIQSVRVCKFFPPTDTTPGVKACEEINMEVREGEFAALIGPSGCGKSTFLYMVAGFDNPTGGQIFLDNREINRPGPDRGIVFQEYILFPWRTVEQNILFGLELQKANSVLMQERLQRLLELTGLQGFEKAYPHTLSGGMQQRVAIARALAYEPEVLLMDEPFGSLDAQTKLRMIEDFIKIWESTKKTVLFVTHAVDEALMMADRVYLFSARPSRIKEVVEVGIPRPRDISSPTFLKIQEHLLSSLGEEVTVMMKYEKPV